MTDPCTRILVGDVFDKLADLPDESVNCVVTSPPYWGLRDYGVEGQIGMEPTLGEHIEVIVKVCREIRRVLRKDGTFWLNYGDCYATAPNGRSAADTKAKGNDDRTFRDKPFSTVQGKMKPKDLCMIPNRIAIALQEPYEETKIRKVEDRAWMAAVIDTDGSIGIRRQKASGGEGWNDTFIPYLAVSVSDRALLEHCIAITGYGTIHTKARAGHSDGRGFKNTRDFLTWRLDGDKAVRILRDVWPWLVVKRQQAACICTLDDSNKAGRPSKGQPVPVPVMEQRRALYDLTKALNQRKPTDIPTWVKEPEPHIAPGWWVRSEIVWHKPNPMPESITDRPATSHEKIWLLTKSARYWYDSEAVRSIASRPLWRQETSTNRNSYRKDSGITRPGKPDKQRGHGPRHAGFNDRWAENPVAGANLRNVWTIATAPFSQAHFATFPPKLIEPCILAGTSGKGVCAACGSPWTRQVERSGGTIGKSWHDHADDAARGAGQASFSGGLAGEARRKEYQVTDHGWLPSCSCNAGVVAATVLDPFGGSGTVGLVANRLGRNAILIELNSEYADMARSRIRADLSRVDTDLAENLSAGLPLFAEPAS